MFGKISEEDGRSILELILPLPPSDNKLYFITNNYGGKVMTKEARAYHTNVKMFIAELALATKIKFNRDVPYKITLKVYFDKVENKGWLQGAAKNRYRRIDVQNRQKLVIDSIHDSIGIDDSHLFEIHKYKFVDEKNPRIEVELMELPCDKKQEEMVFS
jgi:Holliday junction resolvase RusA-like endonuclease